MRKEQDKVEDFMVKAGQDFPRKPEVPDLETRKLRIQLLLEEVLELAEASGIMVVQQLNEEGVQRIKECKEDIPIFTPVIRKCQQFVEDGNEPDLVGIADALADIEYVNLGAASAYGLDLQKFFDEVHDSNMSKFIDGYKDETGKWRKGPSYREPDLKSVLEKQK